MEREGIVCAEKAKRDLRKAKIAARGAERLSGINAMKNKLQTEYPMIPLSSRLPEISTDEIQDNIIGRMTSIESHRLLDLHKSDASRESKENNVKSQQFIPDDDIDALIACIIAEQEKEGEMCLDQDVTEVKSNLPNLHVFSRIHYYISFVVYITSIISWLVLTALKSNGSFDVVKVVGTICRGLSEMTHPASIIAKPSFIQNAPIRLEILGFVVPIWGLFFSLQFGLLSVHFMLKVFKA